MVEAAIMNIVALFLVVHILSMAVFNGRLGGIVGKMFESTQSKLMIICLLSACFSVIVLSVFWVPLLTIAEFFIF